MKFFIFILFIITPYLTSAQSNLKEKILKRIYLQTLEGKILSTKHDSDKDHSLEDLDKITEKQKLIIEYVHLALRVLTENKKVQIDLFKFANKNHLVSKKQKTLRFSCYVHQLEPSLEYPYRFEIMLTLEATKIKTKQVIVPSIQIEFHHDDIGLDVKTLNLLIEAFLDDFQTLMKRKKPYPAFPLKQEFPKNWFEEYD